MQTTKQIRAENKICNTLYHFIADYVKKHGFAPNMREMGVFMDMNSTSQIAHYVRILESWNWIAMENGKCRTMRLMRPTEIAVPDAIREKATCVADRLAEEWEQDALLMQVES